MERKTRLLTAILMTFVMAGIVTFIATFLNLGFDHSFLLQWGKAYAVAWPVAAVSGYLVMPLARRLAERLLLASRQA